MEFQMRLAGRVIGVHSLHDWVYRQCREFVTEGEPEELCARVTQSQIDYEREKSREENPGYSPSDPYLETLAVYRQIAQGMLAYNTFLMHGTVVGVGDGAYMITAASGTGKTTLSESWLAQIPGAYVVNGDKPLIRVEDGRILACGTPWAGKEGRYTNTEAELKGIFLLERGTENRVRTVSFLEGFPMLLQQTYRTEDAESMSKTLDLLCRMKDSVKLYRTTVKVYPSRAEIDPDAMTALFYQAVEG